MTYIASMWKTMIWRFVKQNVKCVKFMLIVKFVVVLEQFLTKKERKKSSLVLFYFMNLTQRQVEELFGLLVFLTIYNLLHSCNYFFTVKGSYPTKRVLAWAGSKRETHCYKILQRNIEDFYRSLKHAVYF